MIGILFLINYVYAQIDDQLLCQPFAPRLSLGYYYAGTNRTDDTIELSFNTNYSCPLSYILINNGTFSANISVHETQVINMSQIYADFQPPKNFTYLTYVRTVFLYNLTEGSNYTYSIFGNYSLEPIGPYNFRVPHKNYPGQNQSQRYIVFGDMDSNYDAPNASANTFKWFQNTVANNRSAYDMLIFLGDMAYDMESQDCVRGDYWMRNISLFTPYWPLQVAVGNHDSGNDTKFPMVRQLFRSPQQSQYNTPDSFYNLYSWDMGLAHFINFQPYWIVYNKSTAEQNQTIYNFIKSDLEKANANREKVPWIIIITHYPMYCSDPTNPMCPYNWFKLQNFTELFSEYKVDLFLSAHQHDYERDKPTINNLTASYESSDDGHIIKNANSPLYLLEGAAGNNYYMPPTQYPIQPFTQFQVINVSLGILEVINSTHLYFEQRDSGTNELLDYVYYIKDRDTSSPSSITDKWWFWVTIILVLLVFVGGGVFVYQRRKKQKKGGSPTSYSLQDPQGDV